jgi:hypothetical protein
MGASWEWKAPMIVEFLPPRISRLPIERIPLIVI